MLADISGFTEFAAATEIEHGPPIAAELLGEVMTRLWPARTPDRPPWPRAISVIRSC